MNKNIEELKLAVEKSNDHLMRIQQWYQENCDGDWEHNYGVKLETLDNPGWTIVIDLNGTINSEKSFQKIEVNFDSNQDWLVIEKVGFKLKGYCAPQKLIQLLEITANWLETNS